MTKRIQIPLELYELMVGYIHDHYDPDDRERFTKISCGISAKRAAIIQHNLFTEYMTQKEPEIREIMRQAYLSGTDIPENNKQNL